MSQPISHNGSAQNQVLNIIVIKLIKDWVVMIRFAIFNVAIQRYRPGINAGE